MISNNHVIPYRNHSMLKMRESLLQVFLFLVKDLGALKLLLSYACKAHLSKTLCNLHMNAISVKNLILGCCLFIKQNTKLSSTNCFRYFTLNLLGHLFSPNNFFVAQKIFATVLTKGETHSYFINLKACFHEKT